MSTKSVIEEIVNVIDPEYLLDREGVTYRRTHGSSGKQLNVKTCPSCGNSNWKVYLNAESGIGNCFVCDHKFNIWRFTAALLGNPRNAEVFKFLKQVASESGWKARRKSYAVANNNEQLPELVIPESTALPWQGKNLRYLAMRGISGEIAEYFHLRYCLNGLFWYDTEYGRRSQDYSRRVIIPIYNLEGDLVSFQGRDATGKAADKYLFPPQFASTGKYLYNGHNAINAKRVVVGEGVFDVMALKIALDEDPDMRDIIPVGTFGKHLSVRDGDDQMAQFIQLKRHGLKEVIFCWDGEKKAIKAAVQAGLKLVAAGLFVKIAKLPEDKDPNEVSGYIVRDVVKNAARLTKQSAMKILLEAS